MKKTLLIIAIAAIGGHAFAQTDLWNQQAGLGTTFNGEVNQVFSDFPTYSSYIASNVTNSSAWNVTSVSVEIIATNTTAVTGITSGVLNVWNDGSSSIPGTGDNPANGQAVTVAVTAVSGFSNVFLVTASNLNLNVAAGNHWFSLTPNAAFGTYGETFEAYTMTNSAGALNGDAIINPGGGFGLVAGTNWGSLNGQTGDTGPDYGGIDIQGSVQAVPAPASVFVLGLGLAGLVIRRRK